MLRIGASLRGNCDESFRADGGTWGACRIGLASSEGPGASGPAVAKPDRCGSRVRNVRAETNHEFDRLAAEVPRGDAGGSTGPTCFADWRRRTARAAVGHAAAESSAR